MEFPQTPGYYWARAAGGDWKIVQVNVNPLSIVGDLESYECGSDCSTPEPAEWGPRIEPPASGTEDRDLDLQRIADRIRWIFNVMVWPRTEIGLDAFGRTCIATIPGLHGITTNMLTADDETGVVIGFETDDGSRSHAMVP